jgi:hypothetical protein
MAVRIDQTGEYLTPPCTLDGTGLPATPNPGLYVNYPTATFLSTVSLVRNEAEVTATSNTIDITAIESAPNLLAAAAHHRNTDITGVRALSAVSLNLSAPIYMRQFSCYVSSVYSLLPDPYNLRSFPLALDSTHVYSNVFLRIRGNLSLYNLSATVGGGASMVFTIADSDINPLIADSPLNVANYSVASGPPLTTTWDLFSASKLCMSRRSPLITTNSSGSNQLVTFDVAISTIWGAILPTNLHTLIWPRTDAVTTNAKIHLSFIVEVFVF